MVEAGLKVGSVFEDGGLCYEVQAVLPNGNYISKRTEKKETVVKDEEVVKTAPKGRGRSRK